MHRVALPGQGGGHHCPQHLHHLVPDLCHHRYLLGSHRQSLSHPQMGSPLHQHRVGDRLSVPVHPVVKLVGGWPLLVTWVQVGCPQQ